MLVKITVNTYFARESSNNRQHLYINTHYIYRNMQQQDNRLLRIALDSFLQMRIYRRRALLYKALFRWQRYTR